jgi:hypothetical protein
MTDRRRLLDLRSGGWLVLLACSLVVILIVWWVLPLVRSSSRAVGDGRTVESYGFDLSGGLVPLDRLAAAGFPKNGLPTLDAPAVMPAAEVAAFNEIHRGKYLVPDDLVIGVEIAGETRAYPVRVLNWHEVVNDTLGGVPIAVTYHPLCDSAVVFDRRLDGETVEFGVSGLLYNSNLLMYDRRSGPAGESLWSQLQARAVTGPAARAGSTLTVLPASLLRWEHWRYRHPRTTTLRPDEHLLKRYQRNPYGSYLMSRKLRFPVEPMPEGDGIDPMSRVVVVEAGGERWIRPVAAAGGPPVLVEEVFGMSVRMDLTEPPFSVLITGDGDASTFHGRWFAWYSQHPEGAPEDR